LNLQKKHQETFGQVMMLAEHMMRPYSRKYDKEEHTYPKEMEEVAKLIGGARSAATGGSREPIPPGTVVNGGNMGAVVGLFGLCWGDVGLFLGMPGSGLATRRSPPWARRSR
jgi:acyl-CoA dehydrogenase